MRREFHHPPDFHQPRTKTNCFIDNLSVACRTFGIKISASNLSSLIPETSNVAVETLFQILEEQNFPLKYHYFGVYHTENSVLKALISINDSLNLGLVTVNSHKWLRSRNIIPDLTAAEKFHSLLILGIYQPHHQPRSTFLYVNDSYNNKVVFVPFSQVYSTLDTTRGVCDIEVLGPNPDPFGLLSKYDLSVLENPALRRKIERRIKLANPNNLTRWLTVTR